VALERRGGAIGLVGPRQTVSGSLALPIRLGIPLIRAGPDVHAADLDATIPERIPHFVEHLLEPGGQLGCRGHRHGRDDPAIARDSELRPPEGAIGDLEPDQEPVVSVRCNPDVTGELSEDLGAEGPLRIGRRHRGATHTFE